LSENPYVAKESDLSVLLDNWLEVKSGIARNILLTAPFGGGKRAIVNELARRARQEDADILVFRPAFSEEEDGQKVVIKLFASIFQFLHGNPALRGKVEMALSSQIPNQTERVQRWYRSFIEGMKKGAPKPGEDKIQIHLPTDNPLIGFIEIVHGMAQAFPTILSFQNTHAVHSLPFMAMLKALLEENRNASSLKLLTIIDMVPVEDNVLWLSEPLRDVLQQEEKHLINLQLQPWTAEDVELYLQSKNYDFKMAEKIVELTSGRPGFIDELSSMLADDADLQAKLPDLTLADLADVTPDEEELEEASEDSSEDDEAENKQPKRKYATKDDAERIAYVSALLGISFPSGIVADILAMNRDSVDDMYDATEDIYKELVNSKPLNTWVYQFQRAMYRESILARHQSEEDLNIARNVGIFVERYLAPSSFGFVMKALHIYGKAGVQDRAQLMKNIAMGADQPQLWSLARDIFRYYDEVQWSDAMRRVTYLNLCERISASGDVNLAETILNEALDWAKGKEDKALQAFIKLSGSKLDSRRRDLYRARTRATESLEIYRSLENSVQQAEALAQLAIIELNDGKPNAALDRINEADQLTEVAPVRARTLFIRGLLDQKSQKFQEALNNFHQSRELARRSGRGPLVLDAGMKVGELLLMGQQFSQAADELSKIAQLAQGLKVPVQERQACVLLAQAHASLQNFEAALQFAKRTLQLSEALKFERLIASDIYNIGLFNLMLKRPSEAVALFKQSRDRADVNNTGFLKELLFNMGQAQLQIGEKSAAEQSLLQALQPALTNKDTRKLLVAYQQLGELANERQESGKSSEMFNNAMRIARETNNKEAQKAIKERMKTLNL